MRREKLINYIDYKKEYNKYFEDIHKTINLAEENQELKKQLEELELQNFNLREDIMIKKMSLPNEEIKDKTFFDLYDMPSYEEIKKQLEQIQQDGTSLLGINETLSRQIGMIKNQQKEFIKYLNNCIKELEKESLNKLQNTINLGIRDVTREILSKFKEIVGDK